MLTLRSREQRGHVRISWLESWHSFSFGDYHDEAHMGWGPLRVINDDIIAPSGGFATHPHRDMEIITYVLSGRLQHNDSLGNGSIIEAGEVQFMRAGTGIRHSEFNPSPDEAVHLLQIWIHPHTRSLTPGYQQQRVPAELIAGQWGLIAGPANAGALVEIAQQAQLWAIKLRAGQTAALPAAAGLAYAHLARGAVRVADMALTDGDGLYLDAQASQPMVAESDSELLFFDLGC